MEINRKFLEAITPALIELETKIGKDFVVFGSAPLYLFGVLEFDGLDVLNDLDVAAGGSFMATPDMEKVLFHDNSHQPLYKIRLGGLGIDIGPVWPGREAFYARIFRDASEAGGFRFASLETVREWKELMVKEYGRQKNRDYLERLEAFQKAERGLS